MQGIVITLAILFCILVCYIQTDKSESGVSQTNDTCYPSPTYNDYMHLVDDMQNIRLTIFAGKFLEDLSKYAVIDPFYYKFDICYGFDCLIVNVIDYDKYMEQIIPFKHRAIKRVKSYLSAFTPCKVQTVTKVYNKDGLDYLFIYFLWKPMDYIRYNNMIQVNHN